MKWTQTKDDLLRRYPGLDDEAMAERIGTTARSVGERRLALGIRKNAKGVRTDVFRLKAKLMKAVHNITVVEV